MKFAPILFLFFFVSVTSCQESESTKLTNLSKEVCEKLKKSPLDTSEEANKENQRLGKIPMQLLNFSSFTEHIENLLPKHKKNILEYYQINKIKDKDLLKLWEDLIPLVADCSDLSEQYLKDGFKMFKSSKGL
ncbi:hypothetical protein [Dokdonia pacifica]|uniref:Lipoprotein n=1 Tax=Dokdonia pacifica TaxID=1627892 RepID=A0A238W6B1_9FLAO|nr:hypothetical protein [Dokdonia pacifica]SNR42115.1 hypothetical protein SAMN06265376_101740 [Dokdonia pacifica]